MSKIILAFDTETTGLCQWNLSSTEPTQPDIIQLAAVLATEEEDLASINTLICPPWPWEMSAETEAIHGFGRDLIEAEGRLTPDVMADFLSLVEQADLLVCHNTQFDAKLVRTAFHRCGMDVEIFATKDYYCTMKRSTRFCNIPGPRGPKWPKLVELHHHLFNEGFDGAHSAIADVRATARCFWELRRLGL
jgi:DNA polymerase-3 subunit epsilon